MRQKSEESLALTSVPATDSSRLARRVQETYSIAGSREVVGFHHKAVGTLAETESLLLLLLPEELIIHMLKFLPTHDLQKTIPLIDHFFRDLIAKYLINTLFYRSLSFQRWANREIEQLFRRMDEFKSRYKITLMNQTQHLFLHVSSRITPCDNLHS